MIENTLRSKKLYKLFITFIKYVPSCLVFAKILTLVLNYLGINVAFALTCISGTSLTFLLLLYLISFIFRFCGLYRLSLNYVTLVTLLTIIDYYIGIPINNDVLYKVYGIITGVFIILWVWFFYKNRNNPKIDHIKHLCDNICC